LFDSFAEKHWRAWDKKPSAVDLFALVPEAVKLFSQGVQLEGRFNISFHTFHFFPEMCPNGFLLLLIGIRQQSGVKIKYCGVDFGIAFPIST
jgi:hypothetical protein